MVECAAGPPAVQLQRLQWQPDTLPVGSPAAPPPPSRAAWLSRQLMQVRPHLAQQVHATLHASEQAVHAG